ncbi:MAG TPA: hypothetical protein VG455_07555 [Acidimicrobiales bacterium]|nr:hypothetical protein [Acidimicrobiales bacterium]
MRRDEIVEVVEVKPVTVGDVTDDRGEPVPVEPTPRPEPVRA